MKKWLENYNDSQASAPEGMEGDGFSNVGRNYSPAWGGQFQMGGDVYPVNYVPQAAMGGSIPGAVGFSYARTQGAAPSNGKYAKKTMASAQVGLDIKLPPPPKSIGKPKDVRKPGESIKLPGFTNIGEVNYAPYTPTLEGLSKAKTKLEKEATKNFVNWYSNPETKKKFTKNTGLDPERMQDLIGKALRVPMNEYDKQKHHDWPMDQEASAAYKSAWVSQQQGDPTAPKTGYISYLPQGADIPEVNIYSRPVKDIIGHELAHASGFDITLAPALYRALGLKLPTKAEQPDLAYPSRYMQRPEEVYGNFHELRLNLGLKPGEKVDRESLKKRVKADPHNATNFWDYYSKDPKTGKEDDKKIDKIVKAINTVASVDNTQQDPNIQTAQNGKEMQYYQNGLDFKPKSISKNGSWLSKYDVAQTGAKKFKLKDERDLAYKPAESTNIKKKNFDLEQDKERKNYISQLADQQKETSRRKKLTQDQREREDYNARNEERGSIQAHVPESTWDRSKAIVSNPLTAFGYAARNESLPARFQHGERNVLDTPIDFINPLQGVAALSEIPGELGRGEFLNAGLSALDAIDLGVYAKGAMKTSKPLLQKAGKTLGTDKLNFKTFKPNPEAYYRKIGNEGYADALESGVIRAKQQSQALSPKKGVIDISENFQFKDPYFSKGSPSETYKGKYMVEATDVPMQVRSGQPYSSFIPKNELQLANPNLKVYKKHWLQGYKEVPKQEDGGIIKDDRGQWDHPGEITEINSNDITMQGVPYDVLGVSDTGDTKLMEPGKNYKFKGKKVTEYPMAKDGLRQEQKSLQNLDQLTNFTNYNKPQPGGWLNKYN